MRTKFAHLFYDCSQARSSLSQVQERLPGHEGEVLQGGLAEEGSWCCIFNSITCAIGLGWKSQLASILTNEGKTHWTHFHK